MFKQKHMWHGDSGNVIEIVIITPLDSLHFCLSSDINYIPSQKEGNKGQTKGSKDQDLTEFHIVNSTFLAPLWVTPIYTTHLRGKKLLRPPIVNEAMKGLPFIQYQSFNSTKHSQKLRSNQ